MSEQTDNRGRVRSWSLTCLVLGHRYWSSVSWGATERHCQRCGHPRLRPGTPGGDPA